LLELPREAFRLFEDDRERAITAFSVADSPVSMTLVFDCSRSMKAKMAEALAGVEQFLNVSMPGDEFSLVRFSDSARVALGFTREPDDVLASLASLAPRGWTALFDAIMLGTQQVRKGSNQRKVLVVFSDGGDNNSRYSESELVALLRERDVKLYALSIAERPRSLDRLADETGGRAFWVRNLDDLPAAIETLSRQMRSEYLIGYDPGEMVNDGKYHRVRVEVQPPPGMSRVRASWRRGYTAPGE
ncbi:MAG: VWA domain-containing protein, partial [Acidobacteria bacterium]|nr:VWA domain-containing protein [Acidobacteriota bacterium]